MHKITSISVPNKAERIFSLFLSLYPKRYKKRFGSEMQLLFNEIYQEEIAKKGSVGVAFWFSQVMDIMTSVIEEHKDLIKKKGMKKYLQQTLHMSKYNVIGFIFLLPFLSLFAIDLIGRIIQGDLTHYNRPIYTFLSHTPLYWTPVLFSIIFISPLIAIIINSFSLVMQKIKTKTHVFNWDFLRNNIITLAILLLGLGCITLIELHDFIPCMVHGLVAVGIGQLFHIIIVCQNV